MGGGTNTNLLVYSFLSTFYIPGIPLTSEGLESHERGTRKIKTYRRVTKAMGVPFRRSGGAAPKAATGVGTVSQRW